MQVLKIPGWYTIPKMFVKQNIRSVMLLFVEKLYNENIMISCFHILSRIKNENKSVKIIK